MDNSAFVIFSVKQPVIWAREQDETWLLNPPRRYVAPQDSLDESMQKLIISISDLRGSGKYRPLNTGMNIVGQRILIERHRDRGLGDLLFLTGPMNYLQSICGEKLTIDMYGLADRSQVLHDHPALANRTTLTGPLLYGDLDDYAAHWFIDTVTEVSSMPDQPNVYDALFRQIGVSPDDVDPRYKRPSVSLTTLDQKNLDALYFHIWNDRQIDLRRTGYYVVAPLSHASLRSAPYGVWLEVIQQLSKKRPVVVVGSISEGRMPHAGMPFSQFNSEVNNMQGGGVLNIMGSTRVRMVMALIAKARAIACGDTGTLYMAQAVRTPAVSLWGTHDPFVRLGYDSAYMANAIFEKSLCPAAPCYAFSKWPTHLCPEGEGQAASGCEVMKVDPMRIVERVLQAESKL